MLFTKPARPGRVKTRLIGRLSPEQAAMLHAAFLDDVLAVLRAGAFDLQVAWALDDGDVVPQGQPSQATIHHLRQQGEGLGERLFHALSEAARRYPRVAAVGSDHPELSAATVEAAFARLEATAEPVDVVLGPAADGGYYLIALRAEAVERALFDGVPWSTDAVLAATCRRAERLGLRVAFLPEAHDVDDPPALDALATRLRAAPPTRCPRTRAVLHDWGYAPS